MENVMTLRMNTAMNEALQLTRMGQLAKATVLLQAMLSGDAKAESSTSNIPAFPDIIQASKTTAWQQADHSWVLPPVLNNLFSEKKATTPAREAPAREESTKSGRFLSHTFQNAAGSRLYKLYVPEGYTEQALPLIVMLHGCTQSADDFAAGTRMNGLADQQGFLVAYPEQPSNANASRCWNWFNPSHQQEGRGEPSLIAGITRRIMEEHHVDPARVYIAGLSAGGAAAAILAATYPELYAAVGIHSGLACGAANNLPAALTAMKQGAPGTPHRNHTAIVPTIVFHGDKDHTVHPGNADHILKHADAGEKRIVEKGQVPGGRSYTRTLYNDGAGMSRHERWVIHGAGHAWSGGSPNGSYTDAKGVDASKEMVRFFLQHPQRRTQIH